MLLSGFEHHHLGPAGGGFLPTRFTDSSRLGTAAYPAMNARLGAASLSVERRAIKPDFINGS